MIPFLFSSSTTSSTAGPGFESPKGCSALVTGSSGLCGARLVEMLLERGAKTVVAFDISGPDQDLKERFEAIQKTTGGKIIVLSGKDGDLTSDDSVDAAFKHASIDCVYHIGALVGPFFDRDKYHDVNHYGTIRVINGCKKYGVKKLVYSSSPSTRFTGADVRGETEDELPMPDSWLAMYAEAKAYGEMEVAKACSEDLLTVSVAPHQVYGPHDKLFLPNLLETAGTGRLRIFGSGDNQISVTYVDNYCHGLLCAADALKPNAKCLGKFYIVTDGPPVYFWKFLNQAVLAMGFCDLFTKFHLPVWFLYLLAYAANAVGAVLNKKFKLNPFNVKMLTIDRYFSIENAKRDLEYKPLFSTEEAWKGTIEWFHENWLPKRFPAASSKED